MCPEPTPIEGPSASFSIVRVTDTPDGFFNFFTASRTCGSCSAEIAFITSTAVKHSIEQALNSSAYRNLTEWKVWAAVKAHRTTLDNGTFRYLDATNKTIKSNEVAMASAGEQGAHVVACVLFSRQPTNYQWAFHDCQDSAGTAVVCVTRKRKQDLYTLLPNVKSIGLASDDVTKLSNAWQRRKLVLNKGTVPYKSMLGEKSLTGRSSFFLPREV